jgi:hypothetical protein
MCVCIGVSFCDFGCPSVCLSMCLCVSMDVCVCICCLKIQIVEIVLFEIFFFHYLLVDNAFYMKISLVDISFLNFFSKIFSDNFFSKMFCDRISASGYMCICASVCMCVFPCMCKYVCVYVYACVCVYVCVFMHVCMNVCE